MIVQKTKFITILILLFLLFSLWGVHFYSDNISWSDNELSLFFVVLSVFVVLMRSYHGISSVSLYSIHFYTFSLFIGGRLWSNALAYNLSPFEIDFFNDYSLNGEASTLLMTYVCGALLAMEIGMYLSFNEKDMHHTNGSLFPKYKVKQFPLLLLAVMLSPVVIFNLYDQLKAVLASGYVGLYLEQSGEFGGRLKSLVTTFTYIGLGFAVAFGNKKLRAFYLALFAVVAVSELIFGARGKFVTFILFLLWLYSDFGKRKISILNVFVSFLVIAVFLVTIFNLFSFRGDADVNGESISTLLTKLVYDQGVSIMVFDMATKIENYPIIPYVQSFIPGTAFIYNLFNPVAAYEVNFGSFLAYSNNPVMFQNGYGLGWSLLADFFVFSGRMYPVFCFFALLWGAFLIKFEQLARNDIFIKSIIVSIAPAIIFLPRAGLFSVIPLAFYASILFFVFNCSFNDRTRGF